MNQNNSYLQFAKNKKNDEFYTTYETIEEEITHYIGQLKNKTILCNCDNPIKSQFCKYFLLNFSKINIKRLICTSLDDTENSNERKHGLILDISKKSLADNITRLSDKDYKKYILKNIKKLKGNGDFSSKECIAYLRQSDIIVTNPPFSLFKEFFNLIITNQKKFLIISNQNCITYKNIFPLIMKGKVWTGYRFGEMKFKVPSNSLPRKTRYWVDEFGQKWRSLGNAMWLTNLKNDHHNAKLKLIKKYSPLKYPRYDNYNAIYVSKCSDIPYDYRGIMAVPLTIIDKINFKQFEIIGEANHGSDNAFDLFKPIMNGKEQFKKILIKQKNKKENRFLILDLFCGAGGFSYGIEKNKSFKTVVALDNNQKALDTFKTNIKKVHVICGDICNQSIKENIIKTSIENHVNMIIGGPPCQGFSLKGKKLGLEDPRNFLFQEYLKIVELIKPDIFIIENVKAILSTSAGYFRDQIIKRVKELGYYVKYGVLNSADFGVPQSRERAFFICSRNIEISLPQKNNAERVTVRDAISDLSYLNSGEGNFKQEYRINPRSNYQKKMREGCSFLYNHIASKHKKNAILKLQMIPPEKGKEFLPEELLGKQKFNGTWGRLKWDDVSPTVDTRFDAASNGRNNHPYLNRAITPREAARLQSFDDHFVFIGNKVAIRQQIGNAVPPLLAKALADQICCIINSEVK